MRLNCVNMEGFGHTKWVEAKYRFTLNQQQPRNTLESSCIVLLLAILNRHRPDHVYIRLASTLNV